jgi:hypothetical protein
MKRIDLFLMQSILLTACVWAAETGAYGQQQPSAEAPKPPARVYGPLGVEDQQDQNATTDTLQPDDRPLTGFQVPTVGTTLERHSYWVPGVSYYNYAQSNGQVQGGEAGWNDTSYLAGNLSLLANWSRSRLAVNYTGGGTFSTDSTVGNGWFQQLSAVQTFAWERVQLTLLDEFAYLPQAQFGFGAGTGLAQPGIGGSLGGGLAGLAPAYSPGQTIFTANGPRTVNTAGVQVNYLLTPRSSITVGGLYSIVRFSDPGNIESDDYIGFIGFNYQISRNDTLGVQYRFSAYHYLDSPQAIGDHLFQVVYGKKITGRLALQMSAGPEITNFRIAEPPSTQTQYIAGSGNVVLSYAFPWGGVSANYTHGITAGSGVFLGASTDYVQGTVNGHLTRVWKGEAHLGYSRNRNAGSGQSTTNPQYDSLFAGASASRPLGRNASLSLGYTAYVETANTSVCAGPNCSSSFTTNQITVGLSWHTRPLVLR